MEKMRPQLFRMASELQPNEEGMSDIIQANDALIRVLDHYERVVGPVNKDQSSTDTPITNTIGQSNQNGSSDVSNAKDGGLGGANDLLLDLADLNFGSVPPTAGSNSTNDFGIPGQSVSTLSIIVAI